MAASPQPRSGDDTYDLIDDAVPATSVTVTTLDHWHRRPRW